MLLITSSLIPTYGAIGSSAMTLKADAAEATDTEIDGLHIKLYAVDQDISEYAPDFKIPEEYPTSFQLESPGEGNVDYLIVSGNSVEVSNDGLVMPWKHHYATYGDFGDYNYNNYKYDYGVTTFLVHTKTSELKVTVELVNYGELYVNKVMDNYIEQNITSDMTAYEKLCKISEFAFSYKSDCENEVKNVTLMIIVGKGNYYSQVIIKMAERLGYEAYKCSYRGSDIYGSNVLIRIDGEYYICTIEEEDFYYSHTIKKVENLNDVYNIRGSYIYNFVELYPATPSDATAPIKGVNIRGYIDAYYDKKNSSIQIPETINGLPVVSISSVEDFPNVKKITLPDTVINIGDSAFEYSSFSEVILKNGITTIGNAAFARMDNLRKIKIPDTVSYIAPYAFSCCSSLKDVTLPSELTVIEN